MNDDNMLKPALIGGVLLGILSAIPLINYFNCFCCAWVIAGGMLAVRIYVKGAATAVTLGRGMLVGLLTGIIGTVVFVLFSIPLWVMMMGAGGLAGQLEQIAEQIPNMPPESRQMIESMAAEDGISAIVYIFGFFFILAVNCIAAMAGGAIGVAVFEKRKVGAQTTANPAPPVNLPPPPPPDTE